MSDSIPVVPFNGWYHVNGNTFGTWLPGDRRGFRTRRHRQHVEGDYKNPPPTGIYETLNETVRGKMKQSPVTFGREERKVAAEMMAAKLIEKKIELLCLSVDRVHYHLLARFPELEVRKWIGLANKNASHALRSCGMEGKIWAVRCRALPIRDRAHQINVYKYILAHAKKGAWTWNYKDHLHK